MQSKNRKKSHQHYIPEFYLNEFLSPDTVAGQEPNLWVYDIDGNEPKRKSPKNIAKETHIYSFLDENGADYSLEEALSQIESVVAPIFKTLRDQEFPFKDVKDRYTFGKFICFLAFRTPQFREHFEILTQNSAKSQLLKYFNERGGIQAVLKQLKERGVDSTPEDFLNSFNKIKIKPPNGAFQITLVEATKKMILAFYFMNWSFLRTDSENPFITSDAPVVMSDPDEKDPSVRYGYERKSIQIIFPVNKALCLLAGWTGREGYYFVNKEEVFDMNSRIAEHASKYIFSPLRYPIWIEERQ